MSKKPSRLRPKVIDVLAKAYPTELRFSELREKLRYPSRSAFSKVLRDLEADGLVIRTEISYKHVTYSLDVKKYREYIRKERERLDQLEEKIGDSDE